MTHFKSAALFTVLGVLLASLAGSLRAAPDQTLGMAVLSAVVRGTGDTARGAGVTSSNQIATGAYEVIFNRDVSDCTFVTNPGSPGLSPETAFVSAVLRAGNVNGVYVDTRDVQGSPANRAFHLLVFCAE